MSNPEGLTALVPRLFVDAFGALPLRVAAGRLLYLGFEDHLDPALALAVERMTGLQVESGLVRESVFRPAHARMLEARFPAVELIEAATEPALAAALARAVERTRPVESRLVRVHDCLWLRMWLKPAERAGAGAGLGPRCDWLGRRVTEAGRARGGEHMESGFDLKDTARECADRDRGEGPGMSEIRTLIVDDSSVMRKIVERALRQAGLDLLVVHEAGSGSEGLELLKANPVDLILSDINMPAMDGLEFLRQIRAQNLAPGCSRGDDHHRIERGARQAGHPGRGAGLHPQAVSPPSR